MSERLSFPEVRFSGQFFVPFVASIAAGGGQAFVLHQIDLPILVH
jgi:hypothetical protein